MGPTTISRAWPPWSEAERPAIRRALLWAGVTTALGSLAALVLARGLIAAFQGKGLVPPDVVGDPVFPTAVGLAAGSTVLLATRIGFPISTTHALIGALVGAGAAFLLPLLTSPFLALAGAMAIYPVLSAARRKLGVTQETCLCVGEQVLAVVPETGGTAHTLASLSLPTITGGVETTCRVRYSGSFLGLRARPVLDALHYLSAGAVSFARGLNDTPKIAALLLVGELLAPGTTLVAVGTAMLAGGLFGARWVADTLSHRVTAMNPGQGFVANLVTAALVIGASRLGLPVSTT